MHVILFERGVQRVQKGKGCMKKIVCIAVLSVAMAGVASAQRMGGGPGGPGRGPGHGPGPDAGIGILLRDSAIAKQAGITDQELASLREAGFAHRREMIGLEADAEKAKLTLQQLQSQKDADSAAVEKAIEEVGRKETEIAKMRYRHRQKIKELVGEDKLQKVLELARERRGEVAGNQPGLRGQKRQKGQKGGRGAMPCPMMTPPPEDIED